MREIYVPRLSDHAYRQFCKRFYEASRPVVEAHVMPSQVQTWLAWGANRIWDFRGVCMVAEQGTIITVYPKIGRRSRHYE